MGNPGPDPDITLKDVLRTFEQSDRPCEPLTATEVAAELNCTRRTAHRKLDRLAERGEIHSKKAGARSRVWWQPPPGAESEARRQGDRSELEQFGAFVRAVEDYAIFMLDPDGTVASWNEGAERIKGYAEEEILGEHFSAFYPEDAVERGTPDENLEAAAAGGRVEDEGWRVRKDGSRFWADVIITAVRDDEGTLQGFTKVTRDRTEQREYGEQIRRERNLTQQILETVPVSISVVTHDGRFVRANSRATERLNVDEGEITEYMVDSWKLYDADGVVIPADERPWTRVAETGSPVYGYKCQVDLPTVGRRWLSINAVPLDDESAEDHIVLAVDDVTEQAETQRELERRKSELETELSEILGRISDAFYALDEEWRFTHVNERSEALLEYSREDLIGESFWEIFPDATETVVWDRFHEAMETQEPVSFEIEHRSLDIWVEINVYPSETGISVYFQDISDRKERERELERYRTIVETVDDGIYTVSNDGTFTMVNEAYAEMTGYPRKELLGADVSLVVDDDVAESTRSLEAEQLTVGGGRMMLEAEIRTADGERVPAEATFALLPGEEPAYRRVGVVRDISERKEQQRALEESERRYRTLVEHFPNGAVALFDDDLRYTAAGGQLLDRVGVDPADRIGQGIRELYPDDLVEEVEPHFQAALEGEANSFEVEYAGRHLYNQTLPVRDVNDEIYGGMFVVQNVTERREYQRKLEESNERLEQFAYAASHDLQEPLRMVSSYLRLIERRYRDVLDEDGEEFIEFAVDGADRMREMIDGLLEYSRVETRGDPFEPVELDAVLDDVREDLQVKIEERDAEISTEPLPRVKGDGDQLRQVFQNLFDNAIEYSGDAPPRIHVSAAADGDERIISVRDEGIGIDPDDADRIFEVFQRLHTQDEHGGTGIGLALCERIVERHGGDIWVDSEPDQGATFSFTLPAAEGTDE